jgi:hypothetical protein
MPSQNLSKRRKIQMDNLFEILIYAIIIISFLSSLFRKKKQPRKPQGTSQQNPYASAPAEVEAETEIAADSSEKYDYDLMKEFERFFKVEGEKTEIPKENYRVVEPVTQTQDRSTPIEIQQRQKDLESSRHVKTESEQRYTNIWERKKKEVEKKTSRIDSAIEMQAAKFEKLLSSKGSSASQISRKIRQRLSDPSTLKEYIIISELIGKPKSLRH